MGLFKSLLVGLLSVQAVVAAKDKAASAKAEALENEAEGAPQTPKLDVLVSTAFPDSEVFGVKLVNGYASEAAISFTNNEPKPVSVQLIGGSLWSRPLTPDGTSTALRNLSSIAYKTEIPAGDAVTLPYKITTDMHAQDVILKIVAVVQDASNAFYTLQAFDEVATVVEPPNSIFDPQILFLYLILAGGFAGTAYFVYKTWVTTLFPQQPKRRGGKDGSRAKTSSQGSKKVDAAGGVPVMADGPAVTTGAKSYDESWIPASHLQRPTPKKTKSGRAA